MDKNQFRLGNLIGFDDYSDVTFEIIELTSEHLTGAGGKNDTWINAYVSIVPIPITNEWLEKFGFVPQNESSHLRYLGQSYSQCIQLNHTDETTYHLYICSKVEDQEVFLGTINYVHELQNLYFSLTGEEILK